MTRPRSKLVTAAVVLSVLAIPVLSCAKHDKVLAHCEIPGAIGRLCFDHYDDVAVGKIACDHHDGARWVPGTACDRTGAATGCARSHGSWVEWMYPGPSETPKEVVEYMARLCVDKGDTQVGPGWVKR